MKGNSLTGFEWNDLQLDYPQIYESLNTKFRAVYSVSSRRLCELSRIRPKDTVVDLGCGIGISTEEIVKIVGDSGRIIGVDVSEAMLTKAKSRLINHANLTLVQESAYNIESIVTKFGLQREVDLVCSNFTYYYLYENRLSLNSQVYNVLKDGGRWAFNITTYLGLIEHDKKTYNRFGAIFEKAIDMILKQRGFQQGIGATLRTSVLTLNEELERLKEAGFQKVQVEAYALPLTPSQAYEFTIEGFYRFGSKPTFSETLCNLDLDERLEVINEALRTVKTMIDSSGEHPTILNVIATK